MMADIAPCTGEGLALRAASEDAAKDRREITFALKNQSKTKACTLNGFATIRLLDPDGKPMQFEVRQNQGDPLFPREEVKRVKLNAGEEASFYIGFQGTGADGKPCKQSARVEVSPPGGGKPLSMNAAIAPCGTTLNMSPIHEGVLKSSTSPNHPLK